MSILTGGGGYSELEFRAQVLLSIQRALWDMVTPDLRGVSVSWGNHAVRMRFLYDRPVTADMREIVREVETYVLADFDEGLTTDVTAEFAAPNEVRHLRDRQWWAYLRRET